ncbi:RNA-binding protein rsd1 [Durusdinium trenchii]|uniref:RNA-binding protein rsd1 n=1 Tax=Durusdinium trenchii TaxID=1381693 RepID=A0ABP0HW38_9DINO
MGGLFDLTDISFFELDRLFARSAKTLKRRQKKRKPRRADGESSSSERSRSPPRRGSLRMGGRVLPQTGGFTDKVGKVERTIVVTAIPYGADEKIIFKHFSKCGLIEDLQMLYNRKGMPTGVAIIEFSLEEPVQRATTLPSPFNEILGQVVQAKRADAQIPKKDPGPKRTLTRQQFTQQVLSGLMKPSEEKMNMRKLHIKNLRPVVRDDDLRSIFKPFGEFEDFLMGSGECWITFKNHSDAQDAMTSMQGFQLVGQELSISMLSVSIAKSTEAPKDAEAEKKPKPLDLKNDSDFGATGSGVSNVHNRIEVMKKLLKAHSGSGIPTVVGLPVPSEPPADGAAPAAPPAAPAPTAELPPAPKPGNSTSCTLLLQNMFNPGKVDLASDPKFYEALREDTHEECAKQGKVVHVTVDPRGTAGLIYVLYETPQQRLAGELALNGAWFEGKKIIATGIDDSIWQDLAAQAQPAVKQEPAADA